AGGGYSDVRKSNIKAGGKSHGDHIAPRSGDLCARSDAEWDALFEHVVAAEPDPGGSDASALYDGRRAEQAAGNSDRGSASGISLGTGPVLLVFVDETVDERNQLFTGAGQDEVSGGGVPIELETGGERRNPNLANRCIRRNYKLAR